MYILAIDQGTTGSTAALIDRSGKLIAKADNDFKQIFPKPGWVEHDPKDIWFSVKKSVSDLLEKGFEPKNIHAIGITNQRETCVVWNKKTNEPVYNAIVWQCRRSHEFCQSLKNKKYEGKIKQKTGLLLDPYFSASKIRWILKNNKHLKSEVKNKNLLAGTIDTYLIWKLTAGKSHVTDVSNASRTMLMNLKTLNWDLDLLKLFEIDDSLLSVIKPSNDFFGYTKGLDFLPDGIPITGVAGDQQAALFGQACFEVGESKCTFGTGSFILLNTGNKIIRSRSKLLTTIAWQLKNEKPFYALEGGAFMCGALVQWFRDQLGLISTSSEIEKLACEVQSSEGVDIVPAHSGLGAPHWNAEARGLISGLTRGSHKSHLAYACLEAMALQNVDLLFSMQSDLGKKIKNLKVDGGATENNLLMQLQSDLAEMNVIRPKNIESTVMGAAYLSGLGSGFWKNMSELRKVAQTDRIFKPSQPNKLVKDRKLRWQKAVKKAML